MLYRAGFCILHSLLWPQWFSIVCHHTVRFSWVLLGRWTSCRSLQMSSIISPYQRWITTACGKEDVFAETHLSRLHFFLSAVVGRSATAASISFKHAFQFAFVIEALVCLRSTAVVRSRFWLPSAVLAVFMAPLRVSVLLGFLLMRPVLYGADALSLVVLVIAVSELLLLCCWCCCCCFCC